MNWLGVGDGATCGRAAASGGERFGLTLSLCARAKVWKGRLGSGVKRRLRITVVIIIITYTTSWIISNCFLTFSATRAIVRLLLRHYELWLFDRLSDQLGFVPTILLGCVRDFAVSANTIARQMIRWGSAAVLCLVGLWTLNLTAYSIWAASFPSPSPSELYKHRAWLFLAISLACVASAGYIVWHFRQRKV